MTISSAQPAPPGAPPGPDRANSPEEAAKQFESVLVRQFVSVMTASLFQSSEEGMMTGQADLQRDVMTDTLTDQLVESGAFGVAELLLRQWGREVQEPGADAASADLRAAPTHGLPLPSAAAAPAMPYRPPAERAPMPAAARSEPLPPYSRPSVPAERPAEAPARPRGRATTMEDALRMYAPAQARPTSIDTHQQNL
jgi:flagellar protein FlgJ